MTPDQLAAALAGVVGDHVASSQADIPGRRGDAGRSGGVVTLTEVAASLRPAPLGFGDWTSTLAPRLAARVGGDARGWAEALAERLRLLEGVRSVTADGPGLLTIALAAPAESVRWILDKSQFGHSTRRAERTDSVLLHHDPDPLGAYRASLIADTLGRLAAATGGAATVRLAPDPGGSAASHPGASGEVVRSVGRLRLSRAGPSRPAAEVLDAAGVRYHCLRTPQTRPLHLDVEAAVRRTRPNPLHEVLWAHSRALMLPRRAGAGDRRVESCLLDRPVEAALVARLADLPRVVTAAADDLDPVRVTRHLEEVAGLFHRWYREEELAPGLATPRTADGSTHLAIAAATVVVLRQGLALLGLSAPERY